ncbi:MAG: hypothetical protein QXL61_08650, partial [Archaeoglobaceae archaeon]
MKKIFIKKKNWYCLFLLLVLFSTFVGIASAAEDECRRLRSFMNNEESLTSFWKEAYGNARNDFLKDFGVTLVSYAPGLGEAEKLTIEAGKAMAEAAEEGSLWPVTNFVLTQVAPELGKYFGVGLVVKIITDLTNLASYHGPMIFDSYKNYKEHAKLFERYRSEYYAKCQERLPPREPGNDKPDDSDDVSTPEIASNNTFNETPKVAILFKGSPLDTQKLLAEFNEPVTFVGVDFSPELLNDYPVLIIPSGGLYGLDSSKTFKSNLEQYVRNGGTLIVFSQQRGYEYSALPGNLSGYGWVEDQSCQYASVYINTYHPILSGQDSVTLDVVVDGYFTKYPENATILLSRTKNGMPAMLMYEYGNGTIIASTIYEDWAYTHYQSTQDGRNLVRDMIAWAKDREKIPEYATTDNLNLSVNVTNVYLPIPSDYPRYEPGETINIPINITNNASIGLDKVSFVVFDPDHRISYVNVSVSIPPNESKFVNFTYPTTNESKRGVYFFLYLLYAREEIVGGGFGGGFTLSVNATDLYTYRINFTLKDPNRNIVKQENVSISVNPGETKIVNFTYENPSRLGIWSLEYEILDYNNTLVDSGIKKFAVSKYAENPKGFVYRGNEITFAITSPEERYAYGSDVPFTIHIWNKGSTDRNISVRTYYQDWSLRLIPLEEVNETLMVQAGREVTYTHTVNVDGIRLSHNQLIIRAEFYENGSYLGRTEKVVQMFYPSLGIHVETQWKEYAVGETVSILLNLTNQQSTAFNATIITRVLDPNNNKVFERAFNAELSGYGYHTETLHFTLPTDTYGIYLVAVEAYSESNKIGSGSTYFEVKRSYVVRTIFDKPDGVYMIGRNMSIDLEITNVGSNRWNSSVNISIPDLNYNNSTNVSLNPNQTATVKYDLGIPEIPAGKHDVIVTIGSDIYKYHFIIPDSKLVLNSEERRSYNAGENLTFKLTNVGGVNTTFNCSIRFFDMMGFAIYENKTEGKISAGENRTISFKIQDQAVSGDYNLIVLCKDNKTGEISTLSKSCEVSGLKAVVTSVTDKKVYFSNEKVNISTKITNLDGSIVGGKLRLQIYSG